MNEFHVNDKNITGKLLGQTLFSLDNQLVNGCSIVNNELVLELKEQYAPQEHNLTEIRLFIHNDADNELNQLEDQVKEHVKTLDQNDDLICDLPEIPFIVPRGKYTASIFTRHLNLHGLSYNFNFSYDNIKKAFLLPLADGENIYFVIDFSSKPLRQGQTIYNYGVINFKADMDIEIELNPSEEQLKNIDPKLEKVQEGKYCQIFANIFKMISKVNIIIPGDFKSM